MIPATNPASRLHTVLSAAADSPKNLRMLDVWGRVFEIEPEPLEVTRRLISVYGLLEETKRLLMLNPDLNHDVYLAKFRDIENALSPMHLQTDRSSLSASLSPEVLTRLEFCSEALRRYYSEEAVSDEDFQAIQDAVEALYRCLLDSNIDAALRIALLDETDKIRKSISVYQIRGAKGVKEALQSLLGCVVLNQEVLKAEAKHQKDVIDRLGQLLDKLDSFTAKALKVHKLLKQPVSFLLSFVTDNDKLNSANRENAGEAEPAIDADVIET